MQLWSYIIYFLPSGSVWVNKEYIPVLSMRPARLRSCGQARWQARWPLANSFASKSCWQNLALLGYTSEDNSIIESQSKYCAHWSYFFIFTYTITTQAQFYLMTRLIYHVPWKGATLPRVRRLCQATNSSFQTSTLFTNEKCWNHETE